MIIRPGGGEGGKYSAIVLYYEFRKTYHKYSVDVDRVTFVLRPLVLNDKLFDSGDDLFMNLPQCILTCVVLKGGVLNH